MKENLVFKISMTTYIISILVFFIVCLLLKMNGYHELVSMLAKICGIVNLVIYVFGMTYIIWNFDR